MPFDDTGKLPAEISTDFSHEIQILDFMELVLRRPKTWNKGGLFRRRGFWRKQHSYCLLGTLNIADHGDPNWAYIVDDVVKFTNDASGVIYVRMTEFVPQRALDEFNDAPTTTHADILDLIARTRKSFEQN